MSIAPPTLYLFALLGAGALTACFVPIWRAGCRRIGLVDAPGHRKIHDQPVALAGGLAILSGLAAALVCGWICHRLGWLNGNLSESFTQDLQSRSREWFALLGGVLAVSALGVLDDRFDLRPIAKLAGQLAAALLVTATGVRFPAFLPGDALNFALTVLWILTVTNAFNFTDNMNGLCAGLAAVGAAALGGWLAARGEIAVATIGFLLAGAALGFLPFNFPRASVFLGDSGSHLLGFALSMLTILAPAGASGLSARGRILPALLLLAVPLTDLVAVVLYRLWHNKPVYVGDNNHFSHRLVRAGLTPAQAVALLWFIGAVIASLVFWL